MTVRSASALAFEAPFDFAATEAMPDWRERVAWPVSYAQTFSASTALLRALLTEIQAIERAELLDTVTLAAGGIAASTLPLVGAALAAQSGEACGMRLVGSTPELDFLRGSLAEPPPPRGREPFKPDARPRGVLIRRLARTASWTPWWRLPAATVAPRAIAVSHNPLLRDFARACGEPVGFRHGEVMFYKALSQPTGGEPRSVEEDFVKRLARALSRLDGLDAAVSARLEILVAGQLRWWLGQAAHDLEVLRRSDTLPMRIWAGTGGYWPVRALSVEVLRRGGEVTHFDHGGGTGMNSLREVWAIAELSVSSRFVVASPVIARAVEASGVRNLLPPERRPRVIGHHGDPLMRQAAGTRRQRSRSLRRVLYAPIPLLGFRQVIPPYLPDPVHLDWQMRLVELLKPLPITLFCRPHPEGLLRGRTHPLAAVTPLRSEPFEELVAHTDVFVFDYVQSTTFYEALCTDRVVVLIDMGLPIYAGPVRRALERRCRIVPARFDDLNRPQVDSETLRQAVCGGRDTVDPDDFRRYLLADT